MDFLSKNLRKILALILLVGIPVLGSAIYYVFIASGIYVVESRFVIQTEEPSGGMGGLLGAVATSSGLSSGIKYESVVQGFVGSLSLLRKMDNELKLRNHYSSKNIDIVARLPERADENTFVSYMRKKIKTYTEPDSSVLVLNVMAFSPGMAKRISEYIISESEILVNSMSRRPNQQRVAQVKKEVENAIKEVKLARMQLEQDLARERYIAALQNLSEAEAVLRRQEVYLVTFIPPAEPNEAQKPERARNVLSTFVLSTLIVSIGSLGALALRDQFV